MNGALVDKQAIKSISDTFRVEDRVKKGKAELFNAESIVLRAELEGLGCSMRPQKSTS